MLHLRVTINFFNFCFLYSQTTYLSLFLHGSKRRFSGINSFNWTFLECFQFQKLNDQQLNNKEPKFFDIQSVWLVNSSFSFFEFSALSKVY